MKIYIFLLILIEKDIYKFYHMYKFIKIIYFT